MPCPKCEAPILGTPAACPECGYPLGGAVPPVANPFAPPPGSLPPRGPGSLPPTAANPFAHPPVTLPAADNGLIEHFEVAVPGPVVPEPVEGLIDSRLFGAYVPEGVDAPPIDGLEATLQPVGEVPDDKVPELELTSFAGQPARANLADDRPVEGLIDSRLFAAFVPEGVDAPMMEGLEVTRFDAFEPEPRVAAPPKKRTKGETKVEDFEGFCVSCGVNVHSRTCPMCGNPARPRGG